MQIKTLVAQQQEEIEALKRAVKRLEAENEGRKKIIIEQKADLRVAKAGGRLIEDLREIALEAEYAKADVERLTESILRNIDLSRQGYDNSLQAYNNTVESLGADYFEQSAIATAIQQPAAIVLTSRDKMVDNAHESAKLQLNIDEFTVDPYHHPGYCYAVATEYSYRAAVLDTINVLHLNAYGISNDPPLVAAQMMMECRVSGKPQLKTVQRLPSNWIENAPKAETLEYALQESWRFKTSGQTQEQFYPNNERTLRKYLTWYEAINRLAREKPEDIRVKSQTDDEA